MDYIAGTHGKTEETHGNTETHPYPSSNLIVHHVLCLSFSGLGIGQGCRAISPAAQLE